ncbi:hypothetical protein [Moorena producens]|uniref:hypothetical protein n=1 Tax=Moorena producens TaxID=1155739 RepID=UPI001314FF09|nr:hypothetical protein [Moorena producens]
MIFLSDKFKLTILIRVGIVIIFDALFPTAYCLLPTAYCLLPTPCSLFPLL